MKDIEKSLGEKVLDMLDQVMMLSPGNDDHSDIAWLYNWLTEPGRPTEDFEHVLLYANRERFLFDSEGGSTIYVARTVAEALAALCPVLEVRWKMVVWHLISLFEEYHVSKYMKYGPISTRLSDWVISIIGDPAMCPDPDMQLEILCFYGKYVRFNRDNREQALTALMSALSSIDRLKEEEYGSERSKDFVDHLQLFKKDSLIQFGLRLVEKLKYNRSLRVKNLFHDISQDYSIGLKTITQPRELKTLIALLKYTKDGAHIAYKAFQDELAQQESEKNDSDEEESYISDFFYEKPDHMRQIHISLDRLFFLVRIFKTALQEPDLLDNTVDCIMDVVEAYIKIVWAKYDDAKKYCLLSINAMLYEFCTLTKYEIKDKDEGKDDNEDVDGDEDKNYDEYEDEDDSEDEEDEEKAYTMDKTPVGQEIIRKYKKRICDLRLLVTKEILFDELFSNKYLNDILYNNQY